MPSLTSYESSAFVKLLLLGESKSGKTGALASLARAGYSLYILDFDVGLDYLAAELADSPDALARIHFETFRDKTKLTSTRDVVPAGRPKAFDSAMKTMDSGIDESGPLKDLGANSVVVVDSLWAAGRAAFFEHGKLQPTKDPRQTYGGAQAMLMSMLSNLTDEEFRAHVVVISHMTLIELDTGITKGLPSAIGKAICSDIPKLFNRMLVSETKGAGRTARRVISTVPTPLIAATSGAVKDKVPESLPVETGLADFFKIILGAEPK